MILAECQGCEPGTFKVNQVTDPLHCPYCGLMAVKVAKEGDLP